MKGWKTIITTIVLSGLLAAPATAQMTATTSDGRTVILHDNGTWEYTPEAKPDPKTDADVLNNSEERERRIKARCAELFKDSFSMRGACEQGEREAVTKLLAGKPDDVADGEWKQIRAHCAELFEDSFSMRRACHEGEIEALRKLR